MDQETQVQCYPTQLIEGDGTFNVDGLDNFIKQINLEERGVSYAIVAIMGPQSSGKSTLLNHLFGTNFREMDAEMGRGQTTKGIWIARSVGIEPCTIVMDLEGTDGHERGEDDNAFEKQSALFAIAISHIVIINMWCDDIGREKAANKPLLKTVFQVMLQLFSPHKTTLMFVIRDKSRTPLEILERGLRKDIKKIWDSVLKTKAHKETQLSEFFNVIVVGLSSYELQEDQFKAEVASLRQKFFHSIAHGGLAGDRKCVVPASGFLVSAQKIWNAIKKNNQLNLPSHTLMVATVLCDKIAEEKYHSFVDNKDWLKLEEDVKSHLVPGFNKNLSSLLDNCLSKYDEEVLCFDDNVGNEKREKLKEKLMQHVQPTYTRMFNHIRSKALNDFKRALDDALNKGQQSAEATDECVKMSIGQFNELCEDITGKQVQVQANCNLYKIRDEFYRDMNLHITKVLADKEHIAEESRQVAKRRVKELEKQRMIAEKSRQDAERRLSELKKKYMIAEESRQDGERRIKELEKLVEKQCMIAEEISLLDAERRAIELEKQRMIAEEIRQNTERRVKELEEQHMIAEESHQDIERRVKKLGKQCMIAKERLQDVELIVKELEEQRAKLDKRANDIKVAVGVALRVGLTAGAVGATLAGHPHAALAVQAVSGLVEPVVGRVCNDAGNPKTSVALKSGKDFSMPAAKLTEYFSHDQ